jgi:hypothetical protein
LVLTIGNSCPLLEERFSVLKQSIVKPQDRKRVIESYDRLTSALEVEAERISKQGPKAIPDVDFATIEENGGQLPEGLVETIRQAGCVIIRNVVSEQQATAWEQELKSYVKRHPGIGGFPTHDPQTFSLFWTPPQMQIRSHPKVLQAMDAVSQLWHLTRDDTLFDMSSQVVYADRFRIRHPSKGVPYSPQACKTTFH